jgi:hypothetical protein
MLPAYYVSIIALFFGIIWVGIDAKKQGFHDKLAERYRQERGRRSPFPLPRCGRKGERPL